MALDDILAELDLERSFDKSAPSTLDATEKQSDRDLALLERELDALVTSADPVPAEPSRALVVIEPAPVLAVAGDDREAFYASISAGEAEKLRATASRINVSMKAMGKNMLEIGRELIAISSELSGHFEKWLRLEFAMSKASAYNYINAAKRFGDVPKVVEILPPATVYRLAAKATPDEVRNAVVSEVAAGEAVSAKDVERRIAEAKGKVAEVRRTEAEQQAQERQRQADEQKWQVKAKKLAEAGKSEKQIEKARKVWDSAKARRERARKEKEAEQQTLNEQYWQEQEQAKQTACDLVDLLRSNLPADVFEVFKTRGDDWTVWRELHRALR